MRNSIIKDLVARINPKERILNRKEYFNSVVLISFVKIENELHILFQKRAKGIRQESEICLPGGGFDKTKDITWKDCILRETEEELGISKDKIDIYGRLPTFIAPAGIVVDIFIGEIMINNLSELNINKKEVEKVFTVPYKWFLENNYEEYKVVSEISSYFINEENKKEIILPVAELNLPKRYSKSWGKHFHKVYFYKYDGEVIWGMTALMIKALVDLNKVQKLI